MTSLAVRLETSSTSRKGGKIARVRERKQEEEQKLEEGGKQEKKGKQRSGRQRMHLQFRKELLKKVRAMQRSHALVCAQNHFQIIHLPHVAVILTDFHGS